MRHDSVIIKSNAYGLTLILNPDIPFEQLRRDTGEKFAQAARFFRNAQMVLSFRGRELTEEEEQILISEITSNARIRIVCIVDENPAHSEKDREILKDALDAGSADSARIVRETLKRGDTLESDRTVIILGNVNPGASVKSSGDVIVLGCCMGDVWAGAEGNEACFTAALTLLPSTLRIASYVFKSAITKREDSGDYPVDPKISYLQDGALKTEPFLTGMLEEKGILKHD